MTACKRRTKTVVVLGGSYGGFKAATILGHGLPEGWRVVMIDRNSHVNHVYALPRYEILPRHEYKAFIPYTKTFQSSPPSNMHEVIHGEITSLSSRSVTYGELDPNPAENEKRLYFDYAIYALGSHLPAPIDLWSGPPAPAICEGSKTTENADYCGFKPQGIDWLKRHQIAIKKAHAILIVGGGPLGIQYATDLAAVHPAKKITLLHSRRRLLPRFNEVMHCKALKAMEEFGVSVILEKRLRLSSVHEDPPRRNAAGHRMVRTEDGCEIATDLILLCTGQKPNTQLLAQIDERAIVPRTGRARILRTTQLQVDLNEQMNVTPIGTSLDLAHDESPPPPDTQGADTGPAASLAPPYDGDTPYPHIFVVGDVADAFGDIQAGHTASRQAEMAAHNIVKLIKQDNHSEGGLTSGPSLQSDLQLDPYIPRPPSIKVSLGLRRAVVQRGDQVSTRDDGVDDLHAEHMWEVFGHKNVTDKDMRA